MSIIRRMLAYVLLVSIYSFTYLVALLCSIIPRRKWVPTGRIMVTGSFHNPNWYLSHLTPLCRSGVKEVILVIDEPQIPLEKVRFVCPPKWMSRLVSRAGARAIWMIIAGVRFRPDLYMGYHIVPGACTALVVGKLLGRPSCYQMTAGPIEIEGGGFAAGGGLAAGGTVAGYLERPSRCIEHLALAAVGRFDFVVVRGRRAKRFLTDSAIPGEIEIITGSVREFAPSVSMTRDIDMAFVGRLSDEKQVDQFISIVRFTAHDMPNIKAVIVGDGPLDKDLRDYAGELGLLSNITFLGKVENVSDVLLRTRVFLLNSQTEGLSIAMAEAMAAGVVPVVADVGELGDLVRDRVNGYLVKPDCIDQYTSRIMSLLRNESLRQEFSRRAMEAAREHCDVAEVSKKWQKLYQKAIGASRKSGEADAT